MYKQSLSCQIPTLADIYQEVLGDKDRGWFVDAGAYDCVQWSNTYELAKLGWRGLFIEPQPDLVSECHKHLEGLPNVTVIDKAVSNFSGATKMRLGGSVSTIDASMIEDYRQSKGFKTFFDGEGELIDVQTATLDWLLVLHEYPTEFDVLSLDVEGSELAALNGFSIDYWRPTLAIVETYAKSEEDVLRERGVAIDEYFAQAGYSTIYQDHINSIYQRPA